jgi:DNA-directed RNA polymerase specialized sigma24 family protein
MATARKQRVASILRRWTAINNALDALNERDRDIVLANLVDRVHSRDLAKKHGITRESARRAIERAATELADRLLGTEDM